MNKDKTIFIIQDIKTDEIILVTKSKERAIDFLPTHRISALETERILGELIEQKNQIKQYQAQEAYLLARLKAAEARES